MEVAAPEVSMSFALRKLCRTIGRIRFIQAANQLSFLSILDRRRSRGLANYAVTTLSPSSL